MLWITILKKGAIEIVKTETINDDVILEKLCEGWEIISSIDCERLKTLGTVH